MKCIFICMLLAVTACSARPSVPPANHYLGLLRFPDITYHIYLTMEGTQPEVINVTFKANKFPLDTIYFRHDSLYFRLAEYFSEYHGLYHHETGRITGYWTGEKHKRYPLEFIPVNPDTVSGLHPRTMPYRYMRPQAMRDGLLTDSATHQHVDVNTINNLMLHIANGTYKDIHSVLIARNNHLIAEEYFYRFHQNSIYNIQSATKSIISALTGIAMARKEIRSIQDPLCAYLPAYKSLACNEQNKTITLEQLLTMNTGIPWDEQTYDYIDDRNSLVIASNEKDQFTYLLSLPRHTSNAAVFAYNSLNHTLMNAVLKHATKLNNKSELTKRILKPLGIEKYYLGETNPMGVIGDIDLRPRDMMKFGLLYLNNGQWNGQQLVPALWIKESTTAHLYPTPTLGYGYFWWTRNFRWKEKTVSSFFAWGYGGQYIIIIPELQLSIVMSGSHWGTDPEKQMVDIVEETLAAVS
jgi:CubicO group peptidase (beta-lactamase class C family)